MIEFYSVVVLLFLMVPTVMFSIWMTHWFVRWCRSCEERGITNKSMAEYRKSRQVASPELEGAIRTAFHGLGGISMPPPYSDRRTV